MAEQSRPGARALLDALVDSGSFRSWDVPPIRNCVDGSYAVQLDEAWKRSGSDESITTGCGTVQGRPIAVAVSDFAFMAGSIGRDASERLKAAIERATNEGLPLLVAPASGGTRMQEGTTAFVEMISIVAAVKRHQNAGLPYLVYLRHPTTGGVLASWGSMGHVTFAEPDALVGFLGPRVFEALHNRPFPNGVQSSEHLVEHGVVDAVVALADLSEIVSRTIGIMLSGSSPRAMRGIEDGELAECDAWEAVVRSRNCERPGVRELLRYAADTVVTLSGSGEGETSASVVLALAVFGGVGCVVIGQDIKAQRDGDGLGPWDLRVARRGISLARTLRLPLVSIIDTPGAELSPESEEGALAGEIARTMAELVDLETPSVSVLLGQGCGGAAIAFLPADRVIAAQHAWLSPLPLEGASVIVHRTIDFAAEMAREQMVGSFALRKAGIVDVIVAELPDAADEAEAFCRRMGDRIRHELVLLVKAADKNSNSRFARHGYTVPSVQIPVVSPMDTLSV